MAEEITDTENVSKKKSSMSPMVIGAIVVVVLILLTGGYFVFGRGSAGMLDDAMTTTESQEDSMMEDDSAMEDDSVMVGDTTTSDESTMNDDAMMEEGIQIEVEGGSFYFEPNEITVEAGQPVTIMLNSVDMMHDFVIDELDVATEVVPGGESTSVTFTPTEPGEYEFYCSVGNHRALGMVGTLIVE